VTVPASAAPAGPPVGRARRARVALDDCAMSYRVAGAGPPVVLLHGLSGSALWWSRNVPHLARSHTVYAIEHARLEAGLLRRRAPFALDAAADRLARWMDAVGLDRASVVGHSMGGFIAADFAARHPARVDRLVLVCAAATPLARRGLDAALGVARSAADLPPSLVPLLAYDALRTGPGAIVSTLRQLLDADLSAGLPSIAAPTLLVWGERDALVPLAHAEALAALLPGATLTVVEGAGHVPMWERPEAFNAALAEFLSPPRPPAAVRAP